MTPLGALLRGFAAGVIGSAVQTEFFKLTASITLSAKAPDFVPPERQQQNETSTATVARRFIENFMQRGPLSDENKKAGGKAVHYLFGGGWGAFYGVARESWPGSRGKGVLPAVAFGTLVWMVSDNFILPVFRLSDWPAGYPLRNHAYAWVAHLVYGGGLWVGYEILLGRPVLEVLDRLVQITDRLGLPSPRLYSYSEKSKYGYSERASQAA